MLRITAWPLTPAETFSNRRHLQWPTLCSCIFLLIALWTTAGVCMTDEEIAVLRQDTKDLFYHGYDNYMTHAFPEDELKPISCQPQTRNRENLADIGLNDVLGNYSLTLIDSLSTLAILASGLEDKKDKRNPLRDFQDGIKSLVDLYGDGTDNKRCGTKACGFDLDSKVQVFETNIRGVGGLLSAHLFAVGELPIKGYSPVWKGGRIPGIKWKNGFVYNGQLLDLAVDLATRLLPAFSTATGIPYPRVNLRTGVPFYFESEHGVCRLDGTSSDSREITENCAAGAGSLILEFSTLSHLTGLTQFEEVAKAAFWAIWERRSPIGLIGNGIDAESGHWTNPPLAGIGAGIDSFYEYSLKSHILLSGLPYNVSYGSLDSPMRFLEVWEQAHSAVKRHIYKKHQEKHPYYGQVDVMSGAPRYSWIDNLSAYYPGLLVLAGEIDEAIESHLLWSALWTRYSALPERWNTANAYIDPNFRHWAGRPEFIESTFHLFQATRDPYYLHVGEMVLRDIRRRCWTRCGWTDLSDINTGEQRDRMESFFLGETAKYLYLLFSKDHPLNQLDRPVVFTTEGHPLVIPDRHRTARAGDWMKKQIRETDRSETAPVKTCPTPPSPLPFTVSNVVNRPDLFHAAALAQLHLVPVNPSRASALLESSFQHAGISFADIRSPTNYTFYPWTLPQNLIPAQGQSAPIFTPVVSTLTFPNLGTSVAEVEKGLVPLGALHKMIDGVLISSLSNMRLNMVQQPKSLLLPDGDGAWVEDIVGNEFRVQGIANWALGRDEKVLLTDQALKGVSPSDPHFTRIKDLEMVDLVIDVSTTAAHHDNDGSLNGDSTENGTWDVIWDELDALVPGLVSGSGDLDSTVSHIKTRSKDATPSMTRHFVPAILPTGAGAAPLPALVDSDPLPLTTTAGRLPFSTIFYLNSNLCDHRLPSNIARSYSILVILRGGCSFNDKLANIPSFAPTPEALQLVVMVSLPDLDEKAPPMTNADGLIRPLLDQQQLTPNGFDRRNPLAMVMVDGNAETVLALRGAASALGYVDEKEKVIERKRDARGGGLGVRRRYHFESMGVPIVNLLMA